MRCLLSANRNGGLKGNMIYSDEKWQQLPGKEEHQMGSAVCKESVGEAWNEREEGPIQAKERRKGGMECGITQRSADLCGGAPSGIEECYPIGGAPKTGWVTSAECILGALVGIEELPSQAEEHRKVGMECGLG